MPVEGAEVCAQGLFSPARGVAAFASEGLLPWLSEYEIIVHGDEGINGTI